MHDSMIPEGCCGGSCGNACNNNDDEMEFARVGEKAPRFRLEGVMENEFHWYDLNDYQGKWVVLYTYPLDFTFICPTEITSYSSRYADFEKLQAQVFGLSTDSVHSHKAWLKDLGPLKHPLLSDMTHDVADAYGCLVAEKGITLRATFIIDPEGTLRYANYHDLDVGRNIEETLRVLEALQTGERCPMNWKPGQQTLGKG